MGGILEYPQSLLYEEATGAAPTQHTAFSLPLPQPLLISAPMQAAQPTARSQGPGAAMLAMEGAFT